MADTFVRLKTATGEALFLRSTIKAFRYDHKQDTDSRKVHVSSLVGQESHNHSYDVASEEDYNKFRDRMLDATPPEVPGELSTGTALDTGTSRDSLRITSGATELRDFLMANCRDLYSLMTDPGHEWPASQFHICYYGDGHFSLHSLYERDNYFISLDFSEDRSTAAVTSIGYRKVEEPCSAVRYNRYLSDFVKTFLVPYAASHAISYEYSGEKAECPGKSRENPNEETGGNPGMLDSFVIQDHAEGFHAFLLTKAHYPELGDVWSVMHRDTRFDCRCVDIDTLEVFTVTISFTIDSSCAKVTGIQDDDKSIDADRYNHYLRRFVDEIVKPAVAYVKFTYTYSREDRQ